MNMQNILAQAQRAQKEITKKQEIINNQTFEGNSEWVKVLMKGDYTVTKIEIDHSKIADEDDYEVLSDMIIIAFNDAKKKVDAETEKQMGAYGKAFNGLM